MATTNTTNLALNKMDLGDLRASWHTLVNANMDIIDKLAMKYAGDPNGNVAGTWIGQTCWNTSSTRMYICTTTGNAASAVWTTLPAQVVQSVNEASDTTCFPLFITASGTTTQQPKNNTALKFNSATAELASTRLVSDVGILTPGALTSASASIAWDANTGVSKTHTFTENTTLANPTNMTDGATMTIRLKQHASSAKTLAYANKWKLAGSSTMSATLGAVCRLTGVYNSTDDIIEAVLTGPFS